MASCLLVLLFWFSGTLSWDPPSPSPKPAEITDNVTDNITDDVTDNVTDNITDDVTSCLKPEPLLFANDQIAHFTAASALQCWKYCSAVYQCHALSFHVLNSTCILLTSNPVLSEGGPAPANFTTLWLQKECMQMRRHVAGLALVDALQLSRSGEGFVIESSLSFQMSCLGMGSYSNKSQQDNISLGLIWSDCSRAHRWSLHEVSNSSGYQIYQLSPINKPDLCLDTETSEVKIFGIETIAVLKRCGELNGTMLGAQAMIVETEVTGTISLFSLKNHGTILFTVPWDDITKSLLAVKLRRTSFYPSPILICQLSQFARPHSRIENPSTLPFLLAGDSLLVTCDPGYELREDDGSQHATTIQHVQCGRKMRTCVLRREDKEMFYVMLILLIMGWILSAILLFFLAVKGKGGKEGNQEEGKGGRGGAEESKG